MGQYSTTVVIRDRRRLRALEIAIDVTVVFTFFMLLLGCGERALLEQVPSPIPSDPPTSGDTLGWVATCAIVIGSVGFVATCVHLWLSFGSDLEADLRRVVAFIICITSGVVLNWAGDHIATLVGGSLIVACAAVALWIYFHHKRLAKALQASVSPANVRTTPDTEHT